MDKKSKSLLLTTIKTVDVDGERRVTFVASDASTDRDGEYVEVETLRLPLKGGGEIRVADLPEEGSTDVDIPLLTDHELWAVDKVIGSVRKAMFVDGKLVFEAGISSRDYAQDVFKLIDEGHLDNAFSISINDHDYDSRAGAISNGEIIEVSLVTRGSNRDAQVLAVKSAKEKPMDDESKKPTEEAKAETPETAEAEEAVKTETTPEVEAAEGEAAEGEAEKPAEENTNKTKEKMMDKEIIKSVARKEPDQTVTAKAPTGGYLKSKAAMKAFSDLIANNRGNAARIKSLWGAHLASKGITGDIHLPMELETMFFHAWDDVQEDALSTFRRSRRKAGVAIAMTGEGEGIRAKGHRKGDKKADQELTPINRDLKGIMAYKKLPIDYIDLLEDEDGELLRFRTEELYDRLRTEVYTAAVLGDGRTAPAEGAADYRMFNGTRGLWSMKADLDTAQTEGTDDNTKFAKAIATVVANAEGDGTYAKIIKTLAAVKPKKTGATNRSKVLVLDTATLTNLALETVDGRLLFAPGTNFEDVFRAKIIELDGIADSGYDVIAYADQGYTLLGTDEMVRTDFDIEYNRDVMLVEKLVAGSAEGHKVVAGYKSA